MSDSLWPHGLQHRQAFLSIIKSWSLLKLMSIESVMPSSHLILWRPLFLLPPIPPSIRAFSMSQFFTSGGQSIGVSASASVLPMNIQNWFPLGLTGWISLLSKGLSRVFSINRDSKVGANVRGWGWVVVVVGLFFNKFLMLRGFFVCWSNLYFLLDFIYL